MRIGFVCPYSFDEPGGVQAHILDIAHKLQQLGHEVQVIGPSASTTEVPDFVVRGGSSIPIKYNGSVARLSFSPKIFAKLREFITQGNFDILHIHEPNSPSFSLAALMLAEGPIVATYHASSSGSKLLKLALPLLRPRLEKIRGGIAVSEMARRWQVEQLGGDPVLIPNGVDTAAFSAGVTVHDGTCSLRSQDVLPCPMVSSSSPAGHDRLHGVPEGATAPRRRFRDRPGSLPGQPSGWARPHRLRRRACPRAPVLAEGLSVPDPPGGGRELAHRSGGPGDHGTC